MTVIVSKNTGPDAPRHLVLAGDIGGTKTNLALFAGTIDDLTLRAARTYATDSAPTPIALIERFLAAEHAEGISRASLGVAGPVVGGVAKATNLPWTLAEEEIKARFNWDRVALINDLVATACAIPLLRDKQLLALNDIPLPGKGNIGLLAAGTGLGEALLLWHGDGYIPSPSEGGHKDFPPRTPLEYRLHRYLSRQYGHASIERVLSGPGLSNIYRFLRSERRDNEPDWLTKKLAENDAAAVISRAALAGDDPVCQQALALFVSIYGAEAGNLALQDMTTGGIYIGGGIGPKIADALLDGAFMEAFLAKGRLGSLLSRIPVRLILDSKAALWGAAAYALNLA